MVMDLDSRLFIWVNSHHHPWVDPVMVYISYPGPLWLIPGLFILYRLWRGDNRERMVWIGLALLLIASDHLCAQILKPLFHRLRPYLAVPGTRIYHHHHWMVMTATEMAHRGKSLSLPSCHAMNTSAAAAYLVALFGRRAWPMIPLALAVAYSRLYLGYHYPGDVAAGMLIGAAMGYGAGRLMENRLLHRQAGLKPRRRRS